jgi:hypothetical protein
VFESMWGSASNTRIHCYNDYLSGIAVAPIGADFGSLGDVSKLDFTSRVRSPVVGQFVILKNTKGFLPYYSLCQFAIRLMETFPTSLNFTIGFDLMVVPTLVMKASSHEFRSI